MEYVWLVFYKFGINIVTWEISLMEGVENTLEILEEVFKGHVPYQGGGSNPLPLKKSVFLDKMSKILCMPLKTFFIQTLFLYCHPCLSTGSKEICIR